MTVTERQVDKICRVFKSILINQSIDHFQKIIYNRFLNGKVEYYKAENSAYDNPELACYCLFHCIHFIHPRPRMCCIKESINQSFNQSVCDSPVPSSAAITRQSSIVKALLKFIFGFSSFVVLGLSYEVFQRA